MTANDATRRDMPTRAMQTADPASLAGPRNMAARAGDATVASPVKRSFSIAGHKTSISLEGPFWDALREAALSEGLSMAELVRRIDTTRDGGNLSSAVRVWLLAYYRSTPDAANGSPVVADDGATRRA